MVRFVDGPLSMQGWIPLKTRITLTREATWDMASERDIFLEGDEIMIQYTYIDRMYALYSTVFITPQPRPFHHALQALPPFIGTLFTTKVHQRG